MEYLFPLCINCLTDDVYSIREAGCLLIKKLYSICKSNEFEKLLIDKINEMKTNSSYLIRNTVLILIRVSFKLFRN
jgi:hypothetical protein